MPAKIGIIAGTGFYNLPGLDGPALREVNTKFGSASVISGQWQGIDLIFLNRHGMEHSVPPHRINYRANVSAMRDLDVNAIIAINVVGSIDPALNPGEILLIDDFIDFTSGRENTFFDGSTPEGVQHIDMTNVYDKELQSILLESATSQDIKLAIGGIYAGFNGPRFETPAEIRFARLAGATVVGMTGCPEAPLVRELGIPLASIALVVNPAAGLGEEEITMDAIKIALESGKIKVLKVIAGALAKLAERYV